MRLLRTGWCTEHGRDRFYPEDLPEAWRLTYFANEFQAVLVPYRQWCRAGPERLRQWRGDVPGGFEFYLDGVRGDLNAVVWDRLREGFGDQLGGLVVGQGAPRPRIPACIRLFEQVASAGEVSVASAERLACEVPRALHSDPRQARQWLGEFALAAPRPALVLMGEAGYDDLRRWRVLMDLLNL